MWSPDYHIDTSSLDIPLIWSCRIEGSQARVQILSHGKQACADVFRLNKLIQQCPLLYPNTWLFLELFLILCMSLTCGLFIHVLQPWTSTQRSCTVCENANVQIVWPSFSPPAPQYKVCVMSDGVHAWIDRVRASEQACWWHFYYVTGKTPEEYKHPNLQRLRDFFW